MHILNSLCIVARFDLVNQGVRQPVQSHTYARLLVFDTALAQPLFAVVNCSEVVSVFYSPVLTRSLTFLQFELVCQSVDCIFLR